MPTLKTTAGVREYSETVAARLVAHGLAEIVAVPEPETASAPKPERATAPNPSTRKR